MKIPAADALLLFVHAAQRRFWAAEVCDQLVRAIWGTGGLLLAAGLMHSFVYPLPWVVCVGVAAVPPAFALLAALLLRRPSLETAARESDRSFGTLELFASAWEQLQLAPEHRRAGSGLVLARASHSAAVLRARLGRTIRWTFPRSGLLPLGFGVLGLLLLLVPGAPTTGPAAAVTDGGTAAPAAAQKTRAPEAVTGLQRALAKLARGPDVAATTADREAAAADASMSTPPTSPPDSRDAKAMDKDRLPDEAVPAGHRGAAGDAPGHGRGETTADDASSSSATLAIRYRDIPTRLEASTDRRTEGSSPAEFEPMDELAATASAADPTTAPSAPMTRRYAPALPPSMRSYIANYFKSIESPQ